MTKILIHDWAGHWFPIDLSRELSRRGYDVTHAYFSGVQGPKGPLERRAGDPPNLRILERTLPTPFAKYDFVRRWFQERRYGRDMARLIREERPDIVLSTTTPLDIQSAIESQTSKIGSAFIYWLQDMQSEAMSALLPQKYPGVGHLIANHYKSFERRVLTKADHVICICDEFAEHLRSWNIPSDRLSVIENWASYGEIEPQDKDNSWSRALGLADKRVFLYAGTLGLKHNPEILRRLAAIHSDDKSIAVVVASEGLGADWLKERKGAEGLDNLNLLPFQPIEAFPQMLASADVTIGIIEPDAAGYSVPSKVLSYLAAGRSILLSVPSNNLIARLITDSGAGVVVAPGNTEAFLAEAHRLISDRELRERCEANARRCAAEKFDIRRIADTFEVIFRVVTAPGAEERP